MADALIPYESNPLIDPGPPGIEEGFFINGEKFLAPMSPSSLTPSGTFYFSRRFQLHGGTYTIKYYVDDAATMWVGRTMDSIAMVDSFHIANGMAEREIYLPSGLQRIDFIVQNLPVQPTPAGIVFSLWLDGRLVYGSSAKGWLWSIAPIPDELLTNPGDDRRLMSVLTLTPNWKDGIVERLEWLTDVLESESGAEQRRALRIDPRRSFEAGFLRKGPNRSMLDSFLTGLGVDEFLMPLWHEGIKMVDGMTESANGVDFIQGMGSEREWVAGDLALVINGDPNHYDVLLVKTVDELTMEWETPPTRSWPVGTMIYPLRKARITEKAPIDNHSSDVGGLQVRFTMSDGMRISEDWLANINGVPLFPFIPNRAQPVKADYDRNVTVLDNNVGKISYTDVSEHSSVTYSFPVTVFGRRNVVRLRQFLQAARGRARSFLMPTFTEDLVPYFGDIDPTKILMVKPMGLGRYHRNAQSTRRAIVVTLAGQKLPAVFRNIVGIEKQFVDQYGLDVNYETDIWYDRIMLDAAMPAIPAKQIGRISFVSEARFDMDGFELQHSTNNSAVVRTSMTVRQLRNRRMRNNNFPPSPPFPEYELPVTGVIIAFGLDVKDFNDDADNVGAIYTLRSDGRVVLGAESTGISNDVGSWLDPVEEAGRYEVRATKTLGAATLLGPTPGDWHRLSSTRSWSMRNEVQWENEPDGQWITVMFEFRDVATKTARGGYLVTMATRKKIEEE